MKPAEMGDPYAQSMLGYHYFYGKYSRIDGELILAGTCGFDQNYDEAFKYYKLAAKQDSTGKEKTEYH